MIFLTTTSDTLEMTTAGTQVTDVYVAYIDHTSSSVTPGHQETRSSSATDSTILPAPAASTQRQVKYLSIRNTDASATQTVTVKIDTGGGTERSMYPSATLAAGEMLVYVDGSGWSVIGANGVPKVRDQLVGQQPSCLMAPHFATANLTGTKTITSGSSFAVYVGKAPRSLSSVQLRARVTTAMATITWGEVAIAKGAINVGGNPTLTVVGYADVSASYNSTGQKTTTISVSSGQSINEGDDLWVIIGNSAVTAAVMRAPSIADDIQVGLQASVASRPSTIVGTPTAFTIESATTLPAWVALVI